MIHLLLSSIAVIHLSCAAFFLGVLIVGCFITFHPFSVINVFVLLMLMAAVWRVLFLGSAFSAQVLSALGFIGFLAFGCGAFQVASIRERCVLSGLAVFCFISSVYYRQVRQQFMGISERHRKLSIRMMMTLVYLSAVVLAGAIHGWCEITTQFPMRF